MADVYKKAGELDKGQAAATTLIFLDKNVDCFQLVFWGYAGCNTAPADAPCSFLNTHIFTEHSCFQQYFHLNSFKNHRTFGIKRYLYIKVSMAKSELNFVDFLQYFPEFDLPISITENSIRVFSAENDPLPAELAFHYLNAEDLDDYTEIIPAVSINTGFNFETVIYWELGLLEYKCYLVNFDKDGNRLASEVIVHVKTDESGTTHQAAVIESDLIVYNITVKNNSDNTDIDKDIDKRLYEITEQGKLLEL